MPSYLPSLLDQKMDRSNTWIVLITGSETKKERIREWCLFPIYFLIFLRQYLFFSFPLAATFSQSTPNQSSQCACFVLLWRNGCFRGRRDFTKDGLSAREEGLSPFSFHCLTGFLAPTGLPERAMHEKECSRICSKARRDERGEVMC